MNNHHELLVDLLRTINRSLGEQVKDVLVGHEIPISIVIIAKHIKLEPGITVSQLARQTGFAKSHISNVIKELGRRGWVIVENDPHDQRLLRLTLSASGLSGLNVIGTDIRRHLAILLGGIPEQRSLELINDLQEVLSALKKTPAREDTNA